MDTREVLRPYNKQRLGFEGVLIDIMAPNSKNGYNYGLVFASVYAPNEDIEIDHVVIQMDVPNFKKTNLERFVRYYFTAKITSYYKTTTIMGITAQRESFMLKDISVRKLKEMPESNMSQPTAYVTRRIHNIMLFKGELRHTRKELLNTVLQTENDGSVEQFINECTESYQQVNVNKTDMEQTLYS